MKNFRSLTMLAVMSATALTAPVWAQEPAIRPPQALIETTDAALKQLEPTSPQVSISRSTDPAAPGFVVTTQPGKDSYPGLNIKPVGGPWDASQFGHIEAHVTNLGEKPISVVLRIDNAGDWRDNPWNAETVNLKPGASGVVSVIFGYAYGKQPNFPLKPNAIVNMVMFATKSPDVQTFRIDSISAAGPQGEKPPVAPDSIRIAPVRGFILGGGAALDTPNQVTARGGAAIAAPAADAALKVSIPANAKDPSVTIKPPIGRWNLRDHLQVRVKLRNESTAPIAARARLDTNSGQSSLATVTLEPGKEGEAVIPFLTAVPINLADKATENHIASNAVGGVTIAADSAAVDRTLSVVSIQADSPAPQIPAWLGKRPPVDGDWVKTLDDEFDGKTLDSSIWNVTGDNYYDKRSHWSKDEVLLGDGVVKLRYEKKRGNHNDDPKGAVTDYAAGFLDTYDKWAQRYGYIEARMKLPKAPGLWPAFWLMPDRGRDAGIWWKRKDTKNGGMEFDIMEHLTGWGPNRYNIAHHWDGYEKEHKSNGSGNVYVQPDKDGYITAGLLWTPGSAVYYCNGREVLRWENERISNVPSLIMFTIPSGGWDNTAFDEKQLPSDLTIDYVRVWQRKDLASPGDGKKPPAPPVAAPAN